MQGHLFIATTITLSILFAHHISTALSLPFFFRKPSFDFDVVVIGAGASGLFASGTSSGLNKKTLLIEKASLEQTEGFHLGGDCTNTACVPSKALRAASRAASRAVAAASNDDGGRKWRGWNETALLRARRLTSDVVNQVRNRERLEDIADRNPNLSVVFVAEAFFVSPHELCLRLAPQGDNQALNLFPDRSSSSKKLFKNRTDSPDIVTISSKQFLIATGAGPRIPPAIERAAIRAKLPILTYRSLLRPESTQDARTFWNLAPNRTDVLIAGGGPTACELAQSLGRLGVNVTVVAPDLLPDEDISSKYAAVRILNRDGVGWVRGKLETIQTDDENAKRPVVLLRDKTTLSADYLILALGRSPASSLKCLKLDNAGVTWSENGVHVDRYLRSTSCKHVFACGDCVNIVPNRDKRSSHAGWMGFHSIRSMINPPLFKGGPFFGSALHPHVPRVVFTDPMIGSIGLTRRECYERYGSEGFQFLSVDERGTDQEDIDAVEQTFLCKDKEEAINQQSVGFVELRIRKRDGRILGATVCSPLASELINQVAIALANRMTCRDFARSLFVYPSRGYLLYRVCLSLAIGNVWGFLASCGPLGRLLGCIGRNVEWCCRGLVSKYKLTNKMKQWQASGSRMWFAPVGERHDGTSSSLIGKSFLEVFENETLRNEVQRLIKEEKVDYSKWINSRPV